MKLLDTDCCDLRVDRSTNTRMVSGKGDITGHLKFNGKDDPYIIQGIICRCKDEGRSINAYWRGLGELKNFNQLKGKSIILTMDENPDEEDFGYYYNFHKDLHWLRIDFINMVVRQFM